MEFLQLVETLRAEEASPERLFRSEGLSLRSGRRAQDPNYLTRLREAAEFIADVYEGRRHSIYLREAMTTSDFPLLFGDVLDRQLLGRYAETPSTIGNYITMKTVRDFRPSKMFTVDGAEGVLSAVAQREEYPMEKLSEGRYTFSVSKYGRVVPFSWETMINDDLDALKDVPDRLGRAARRSEEKFGTSLFVLSTGPDSTFFSNTHKNILNITNLPTIAGGISNPPLSIMALQDAMTLLSKQVDADSEPIVIDMVSLVVPPALEVVAQNILNATELWLNAQGAMADQQLHTVNWMRNRTTLSVNHYLPIIDTTHGNTAWYLFASTGATRPALVMAKLRGHEQPELFMKSPNALRIGGGEINPMDGDFDTDSLEYKLRHVYGGTQVDSKGAISSTGASA
jgi:hypothetical protein